MSSAQEKLWYAYVRWYAAILEKDAQVLENHTTSMIPVVLSRGHRERRPLFAWGELWTPDDDEVLVRFEHLLALLRLVKLPRRVYGHGEFDDNPIHKVEVL